MQIPIVCDQGQKTKTPCGKRIFCTLCTHASRQTVLPQHDIAGRFFYCASPTHLSAFGFLNKSACPSFYYGFCTGIRHASRTIFIWAFNGKSLCLFVKKLFRNTATKRAIPVFCIFHVLSLSALG